MEKDMRSEEEEVEDFGKNNHSKTQVPLFLFISPSPSYSSLSPSIPSRNLRHTPPSLSLCPLLPPFSPTPNPPPTPGLSYRTPSPTKILIYPPPPIPSTNSTSTNNNNKPNLLPPTLVLVTKLKEMGRKRYRKQKRVEVERDMKRV
ncbi:hypothetical protein MtrunA17_Chr8g0340631 [Medicago truncatula]|uniref:Uncharacterized protein n=1 Tax=Medicago truncatula TaxID=3880 RepID=G7LGM6_MEDTR|nr:hypothetical protein MTR_8g014320 [Medicago truncatula]RHN39136.1 hypothetical protein MtrunA17_Chr8g0340631 [Medicago truncatula]